MAGCWTNARGQVEKGYNVRRFPTFAALMFDLLLVNKLLARNKITRAYKMHDFDHCAPALVEHANDCVFMSRLEILKRLGGFPEQYFPGWFDQVELCQKMRRHGYAILYDPEAKFVSNGREPLINRLVRDYYPEFYASEYLYVKSHFNKWQTLFFRLGLTIGMCERLLFSLGLPGVARNHLLTLFRSYVGDDHIRDMRSAYWSVLKGSIMGIRTQFD